MGSAATKSTLASLEKRAPPDLPTELTGLYPGSPCKWDARAVRTLILARKLAPLFKGVDEGDDDVLEECPICFLYYQGGLNWARCCKKRICTECFLHLTNPRSTGTTPCPFCNRLGYAVSFSGPLAPEERAREQLERQKVQQATLRMRKEEEERDRARELQRQQQRSAAMNIPGSATSTSTSSGLATPLRSPDAGLVTIAAAQLSRSPAGSEVGSPPHSPLSLSPGARSSRGSVSGGLESSVREALAAFGLDIAAIETSNDPELELAIQLSMRTP